MNNPYNEIYLNGDVLKSMDEDLAKDFIKCMLSGLDNVNFRKGPEDMTFTALEKLLKSYLDSIKMDISAALFIWVCILSKGNPGNLIMLVWCIANKSKSLDIKMFTLSDWGMHIGVISDEEFHRCWLSQKDEKGFNRLDHKETWAGVLEHFEKVTKL